PCDAGTDGNELAQDRTEAAAIEEPPHRPGNAIEGTSGVGSIREQPGREHAPDAAQTVDAGGADGVIEPAAFTQEHAPDGQHAADDADQKGGPRGNHRTTGTDGDKTREQSIARQ